MDLKCKYLYFALSRYTLKAATSKVKNASNQGKEEKG